MTKFIDWRRIIKPDVPLYAHLREEGSRAEWEELGKHLELCQAYFLKIDQEKNLLKTALRFFEIICPGASDGAARIFAEMFAQVITFHDIGKVNPLFQRLAMKNKKIPNREIPGLSGREHSMLSSIIYLDYYLFFIENSSCAPKEQSVLKAVLWENAYVISKHHSDLQSMAEYMNRFRGPVMRILLTSLAADPPAGLDQLKMRKPDLWKRECKEYEAAKKVMTRAQDINCYFYIRLLSSALLACDYYATTEFMSGTKVEEFGTVSDPSVFQNSYENCGLVKEIRKNAESLKHKNLKSQDLTINDLRSWMFLEAERRLKEYPDEEIYFLEAPTGGGKSNTAMNLSFQLLKDTKKIFYIYPFNTLVDQNLKSLKDIFGQDEAWKQIAVINSLTPIRGKGDLQEDSSHYYEKALLDRQFLNNPFILSTHVSFFRTLFGDRREDLFGFLQLSGSVVVLDEIQSYRSSIWSEIIIFLKECASLMGMKIIIMSATLPGLEVLGGESCRVVRLIKNRQQYFNHHLFRDRVQISYELMNERMTMERLLCHVAEQSGQGKKILVTFIKKESAYKFYHMLCQCEQITVPVQLITGDDSAYERELILKPIRQKMVRELILVATQVIESGVDIGMDVGYKDISKLDSEEQFLGRINRSFEGHGLVFFFHMDQAEMIYRDDYRLDPELTLLNPKMRELLITKDFPSYYERVLELLRKMRNESSSSEGIAPFFENSVKWLDFPKVEERMRLIDENKWTVSLVLCRVIVLDDGTELDGFCIWNQYKALLQDRSTVYAEKQVKLSEIRHWLSYFIYELKWNPGLNYSDVVGELYCIEDGERYFENGKLNREMLEERGALFVD